MNFSTSSIAAEVSTIINAGAKKVHGYYHAELLVKGKIIRAHKVVNVDIYRDFLNNYCDEVIVELFLSAGVYENDIIPNKENIEIRIYNKPFAEGSDTEDLTQEKSVIKGRAVLTDKNNQFFANNTSATKKETRDLMAIQKIKFQVLNPLLEAFRMQSTGGIFRLTTGADLIKMLLATLSNSNDVEQDYKVKGVDVAPKYNEEVKNHINIPMGIKVLEVPDYINKNIDGIYAAGMGFYLQKDIWYLYPTFDVDRFDSASKTLTVLRVPSDTVPLTDRTFLDTPKSLTIIANKETNLLDSSDIDQLNIGNGLRFTDAKAIVEDFVAVDGNKAIASRGKNVSEFVSDKRSTNLNNVSSPSGGISSNMYYEMSQLARRNGSTVDITWEYSDSTLLYPGMPVRFMTLQGSGLSVIYGVLLAAHEMIMLEGKGTTASKHKRSCVLSVFVKRKLKWNEDVPEDVKAAQ